MDTAVATAAPDEECKHPRVTKDPGSSATFYCCPDCKRYVNGLGRTLTSQREEERRGTRGGVEVSNAPQQAVSTNPTNLEGATTGMAFKLPPALQEKVNKFREKHKPNPDCKHLNHDNPSAWGFWCEDCDEWISQVRSNEQDSYSGMYDSDWWERDTPTQRPYAFGEFGGGDYRAPTSPYHGNALRTIFFYATMNGGYAFDDSAVNCRGEAMVAGMPAIMDLLQVRAGMDPGDFKCTFSDNPFPGSQIHLEWVPESKDGSKSTSTGNWYRVADKPEMEGWLCPALFKFFKDAPKHIYAKAEEWIEEPEEQAAVPPTDDPQEVVDAVVEAPHVCQQVDVQAVKILFTAGLVSGAVMALTFAVGLVSGYFMHR